MINGFKNISNITSIKKILLFDELLFFNILKFIKEIITPNTNEQRNINIFLIFLFFINKYDDFNFCKYIKN